MVTQNLEDMTRRRIWTSWEERVKHEARMMAKAAGEPDNWSKHIEVAVDKVGWPSFVGAGLSANLKAETEEDWRKEYDKSPKLQAEFGNRGIYIAFKKAITNKMEQPPSIVSPAGEIKQKPEEKEKIIISQFGMD